MRTEGGSVEGIEARAALARLPHDNVRVEDVHTVLNRAIVAVEAMKAQWRRGLHLNTHERMAMGQLWLAGALSMSHLGDLLGLSRAAVTSLVDGLEQRGFVARAVDPMDRRRTLLRVDPAVVPMFEEILAPYDLALRRLAESLAPEQWEGVVTFLQHVERLAVEHRQLLRAEDIEQQRKRALDAWQRARPGHGPTESEM